VTKSLFQGGYSLFEEGWKSEKHIYNTLSITQRQL
jgi:hypothetical protein